LESIIDALKEWIKNKEADNRPDQLNDFAFRNMNEIIHREIGHAPRTIHVQDVEGHRTDNAPEDYKSITISETVLSNYRVSSNKVPNRDVLDTLDFGDIGIPIDQCYHKCFGHEECNHFTIFHMIPLEKYLCVLYDTDYQTSLSLRAPFLESEYFSVDTYAINLGALAPGEEQWIINRSRIEAERGLSELEERMENEGLDVRRRLNDVGDFSEEALYTYLSEFEIQNSTNLNRKKPINIRREFIRIPRRCEINFSIDLLVFFSCVGVHRSGGGCIKKLIW